MPWRGPEWEGEFPTLGYQVAEWIETYCVVPDRADRGEPLTLSDEQLRFLVHHYRLEPNASEHRWEEAFKHTRSMLVRPQKWGKGPLTAAMICAEAVGPTLFAGWDAHGEPVGQAWPTPIIQLAALAEDQTKNVWTSLIPMIELGPLGDVITDTGVTRINLSSRGWIEPITMKSKSKIGARVTFAVLDEAGLWATDRERELADTLFRGLAGTGGRAVLTTNAWDLSEDSVAQQMDEAGDEAHHIDFRRGNADDLARLSYTNQRDRTRIHRHVYGDSLTKYDRKGVRVSGWINLERIEKEISSLLKRDPSQAKRFFGNIATMGAGAWMPDGAWATKLEIRDRPAGVKVCLGFDGSDIDDWTGIRLETEQQYQFTPVYANGERRAIWNPKRWPEERVPRGEVMAAFEDIFRNYQVVRAYLDPPLWQSEIAALKGRYGDKVVYEWPTYRLKPMHSALEQFKTDVLNPESALRHDDDRFTELHIRNAVVRIRPGQTYLIGKASDQQKIDLAMSSVLAHEATQDAIAAGEFGKRSGQKTSTTFFGFS